jgi:hypothetical protein
MKIVEFPYGIKLFEYVYFIPFNIDFIRNCMEYFKLYLNTRFQTVTNSSLTYWNRGTILLLGLLFGFSFTCNAQNIYLKIPENIIDKETINNIIDSLKNRSELKEYLVYQRVDKENYIVSYLVSNNGNLSYLWTISEDKVLNKKELINCSIFSYKFKSETGAIQKEDKLEFKPPMLSVIDNEVVIYGNIKTKIEFYFEYGKNVITYAPIPERDRYRERWLDIICKDLL